MNNENAFLGVPFQFLNYCKIYPPSIKQTLENSDFNKYLNIFTISQEDIEDELFNADDQVVIAEGQIPTPYQYISKLAQANPIYLKLIQDGFKFFTHEDLTFLPNQELFLLGNIEDILLKAKDINDLPVLKEEDYFTFQNLIRASMGIKEIAPYNYNRHPKIRRMEAKKRLRDRVKSKQEKNKGSFLNNLASICCMGIGLNPLNIGEMSYAAIAIIIEKYQMKERYDIDMRIATSGFGSKKIKPKYWMTENDEK